MVRGVTFWGLILGLIGAHAMPDPLPVDYCTPTIRSWGGRLSNERAILAVATEGWHVFDLAELPFLGPYRPAGVDTIRLDAATSVAPDPDTVWVVTEDGDSIPIPALASPTALLIRRPATPTSYVAQSFRTLSQGAGPGYSLHAGALFWAIPYGYGPDCRWSPFEEAEWIPSGDTVVFLVSVEEQGTTPTGELIFRQPYWLGPYPHARGTWPDDLGGADPVVLFDRVRR